MRLAGRAAGPAGAHRVVISAGKTVEQAELGDVDREDLVAVEVYRGFFEVPEEVERQILANTLGTRRKLRDIQRGECGLVILWTERGWEGRR